MTRRGSRSRRKSALDTPEDRQTRRYYEAVEHAAGTALDRVDEVRRFLAIAGEPLCLRFAGAEVADAFMPALSHLAIEAAEAPALTVRVWDSRSSDVAIPRSPWKPDDYLSRGDIRGCASVRAAFNLGAGTLSLFDPDAGTAVFWVNDARTLPSYERAAPLRTILGWFLRTRGRELLHAGAVGMAGGSGGVLLAGRGGRGKSTTALSCLTTSAPLCYAADDYVAVDLDPVPWVHCIYSSGKLEIAHALRLLPELVPLVSNPGAGPEEKGLLFVHQHFPERIASGFPLRAILLPEVTAAAEGRPALLPVSPLAVLQELAASTMGQMPGTDEGTLRLLGTLLRALPCYRLAIGPDLANANEQIFALLRDAA